MTELEVKQFDAKVWVNNNKLIFDVKENTQPDILAQGTAVIFPRTSVLPTSAKICQVR